MINLEITEFDLKIIEYLNSILDKLVEYYSKNQDFLIRAISKNGRSFSNYTISGNKSTKRVEEYFETDEWKSNVKLIEDWLDIKDWEMEEHDLSDIFEILNSAKFKKDLPSFEKRVNFKFQLDDFDLATQSEIWLKYIYHNEKKYIDKDLSKIMNLMEGIEDDGTDILSEIDGRILEQYEEPIPPFVEDIAIEIALLEFRHKFVEIFIQSYKSIPASLSLFKDNFLSIPQGHFTKDDKYATGVDFILSDFLAYHAIIFTTTGWICPMDLGKKANLKDINVDTPWSSFVMELITLTRLKLQFLEEHFNYILEEFIDSNRYWSNQFGSTEKLLEYLGKYYLDISSNENLGFNIIDGVGFPDGVDKLFCKCLHELMKKRLMIEKGELMEYMVLPSALVKKGLKLKNEEEPLVLLSPELDRSFFVKNKIHWPKEEKFKNYLNELFRPLYTEKTKKGKLFMQEKDVLDFLQRNFNCYSGEFAPKVYDFNGHTSTLRHFILSIGKTIRAKTLITIEQKRLIQLMLQNFSVFSKKLKTTKTQKKYEEYCSNISPTTPSRYAVIYLDIEKLEKILQ